MPHYYFTSKTFEKSEKIARCSAKTLDEAIETFAAMKNLPRKEFIKIYETRRELPNNV